MDGAQNPLIDTSTYTDTHAWPHMLNVANIQSLHMNTSIHIHIAIYTHMWMVHRTSYMDMCIHSDTHMAVHTHKWVTENLTYRHEAYRDTLRLGLRRTHRGLGMDTSAIHTHRVPHAHSA